jgi:hypothetical protein
MTSLLEQAFKQAAQQLTDMESERQWGEAFNKAPDKLELLAEQALEEYKAGKTTVAGFDEL